LHQVRVDIQRILNQRIHTSYC